MLILYNIIVLKVFNNYSTLHASCFVIEIRKYLLWNVAKNWIGLQDFVDLKIIKYEHKCHKRIITNTNICENFVRNKLINK